jgi:hypothetical protein
MTVQLEIKPLGPYWVPPRPAIRRQPPQDLKLCSRCEKYPAVKFSNGYPIWCDRCEEHQRQIYNAGGANHHHRGYIVWKIRQTTMLRMEVIRCAARINRAKQELEAAILAGEQGYFRESRFKDFGEAWARCVELRREIMNHRSDLQKSRPVQYPLP